MAITTLDGLVTALLPQQDVYKAAFTGEAAGQMHSSWYLAGLPGAATAPSMGINGTATASPVSGQIWFPPSSAGKDIYVARLEGVQAGNIGGVTLCDRIWYNSGQVLATTTAQSITMPTLDRDNQFDGAFTGVGVQAAIEVHTATLNNAAITNTTLSYTNSDGTSGRTATISPFPATAVLGTFVPFTLQAGDKGIRSVQSVTHGTTYGTTGGISLVLYRQVASLGFPSANIIVDRDGISLGLQRMHDGSVPFLIYSLTGTAAGITDLGVTWAQG